MALRLHIVGAGRVGRVLARRWRESGLVDLGWILNRSLASAADAVAFIGAGRAVARAAPVAAEDWLMLALPDSVIAAEADRLAGMLGTRPALAFHLSGAEPARALRPLAPLVAAVHPVCPFASPALALSALAGRHAIAEGDGAALDALLPMFEALGMRTRRFAPTDKRLYHAAMIAASNFLATLDALALDLAESAGLDSDTGLALLCDLQRSALATIEGLGPVRALTGPFERGDRATVARLLDAARQLPPDARALFAALAQATEALAARKHAGADGPCRQTGIAPRPGDAHGRV